METNSRPGISALESHLGYWLRRVSNRVSGSFAHALNTRNTSVAEWVLMRRLHDGEHTSPGGLAESLAITRGAVSKIIDKLEQKDWIRCKANQEDGRGQWVSFTPKGRKALPELAAIADRNDDEFFACLNQHEKTELLRLLRKLAGFHQIQDVPTA